MTKRKIFKVVVKRILDEDGDFSWIGKYTDDADEWNIDRQSGEYVHDLTQPEADCSDCEAEGSQCTEHEWQPLSRSREFRFFKPYAGGEKEGTEDYKVYGLQDYKRCEEYNNGYWHFIGIRAEAEVGVKLNGSDSWKLDELTSGGLWGIESDSDKDHFKEVAGEELSQLRKILEAYGFSEKQIDAAFQDIEEQDE
jgi:hypothetical protein